MREDKTFRIKMSRENWSSSLDMYFSDTVYETNTILKILQHTLIQSNERRTEAQRLPRSRCFQAENTSSKLGENVGITKIMELSIVNWTIIMCTFWIFAHTFG